MLVISECPMLLSETVGAAAVAGSTRAIKKANLFHEITSANIYHYFLNITNATRYVQV